MLTRLLTSLFTVSFLAASAGERQDLWPEGRMPDAQDHQIAAMTNEIQTNAEWRASHRMPFLEWMDPPKAPNGCCMVMLSGGAYGSCCDCKHIQVWTEKFTAAGYQCVNLVYRTPRPKGVKFYQTAWEDGERGIRLVRQAAAKRGFDPEKIGTISMSAGSHLALLLAVSSQTPAYARIDEVDDISCHLNWAITGAIAYAYDGGGLDPILKFDEKTAPMCMFHGSRDPVTPLASTQVYRRLHWMKIPAELHLFADRDHAFWGFDPAKEGENGAAYDHWYDRAQEFLNVIGYGVKLGPEIDIKKRFASDEFRGENFKEDLWPKGKMPDDQPEFKKVPYLEWNFPKVRKTNAVVLLYSGGGYMGDWPNGFEVKPARRYLNEKGMTVVVMSYRAQRLKGLPIYQAAWEDLQRAIRVIRSRAPQYGLDPDRLGIWGSSAGGHMAMLGITSSTKNAYEPIDDIDKTPCNPNWAVVIYPANTAFDWFGEEKISPHTPADDKLLPEFLFDGKECPAVFVHGDADEISSMSSVLAWEKLREKGVHCDLHTLATRYHCFYEQAAPGTGSYTFLGRIWEFLNHKGINK